MSVKSNKLKPNVITEALKERYKNMYACAEEAKEGLGNTTTNVLSLSPKETVAFGEYVGKYTRLDKNNKDAIRGILNNNDFASPEYDAVSKMYLMSTACKTKAFPKLKAELENTVDGTPNAYIDFNDPDQLKELNKEDFFKEARLKKINKLYDDFIVKSKEGQAHLASLENVLKDFVLDAEAKNLTPDETLRYAFENIGQRFMPTFDRSVESQAYDKETGPFIIASYEAFEMMMKALIANIFGLDETHNFMKEIIKGSKGKQNSEHDDTMQGMAAASNVMATAAAAPKPQVKVGRH